MNASIEISPRRAAEWLFTLIALGEIAVGILLTLLPGRMTGILLGVPLDGTAAVATRMLGIAVAAVGVAWWPDRNRLDPQRLRQVAAGFLVYNLGVGVLFLAYAWTADRALPMSWLVGAVHLLVGCTFIALMSRAPAAR